MGQQVVTELVIDSDTSGADRFSQSMDKAGASAQRGVNSAAGLTLAIAGVGVAFVGALVGLRSFFDYVGQQNKQLVDISENALRAGMSARDFQETLFAARSKGLTEKDFVSGLDKISTDLTSASSGVTEFGRLFEANGLKIKNANGELKTSNQALADIAGLMQNASPVIQQGIAKIVGLSKDWIPFLRDGVAEIEKQKKSAADLGVVISDDVIAKAKEFDAQWKTAIATWDLQFKASLAEIMPLLIKMATLASTIIEGVGSVNSSVSRWMTPDEDKSKAQLNDQINDIARLRDMMESLAQTGGELKKLRVTNLAELVGLGGEATIKDVDALLTKLSALYDKAPTKLTVNATGTTVLPANDNKNALDTEIDRLQKHIAITKADTEAVGESSAAQAGLRAEATLYAAAARAKFTDLEQFADKFMKIREEVEAATQALNKAKVAADIKLGRDTAFLSSEDLQITMKLKDTFNNDIPAALGSSEAAALRFNSQLKQMNDVARSSATQFTDNLIKGLASGQTAVESLHNAFKSLASSLTSGALKSLFQGDFLMAGIQGIAAIGAAIFSSNTSSSGDRWLAQQRDGMATRSADYSGRSSLVGVDTNTRQGAIFAQDAQFVQQRIAENKAGGQQMNQLLQLQVQERNQLLKDWDAKDTAMLQANADAKLAIEKAATDRSLGFQNRLFAATNDFSTLEGQLAAFDRTAQQERIKEAANDNAKLVDLDAATAAERLNVIKTYNAKIVADTEAAALAQRNALNTTAKNVVDYLNNLVSGPGSTSSPAETYSSARSVYNANLALAIGGNVDAQSKFPQLADNLEKAARAVYASAQGYQDIKSQIISQGLALPAVVNTTDPVVQAMRDVLSAINAATLTEAKDATLQGVIKSAIDAGNAAQIAALLIPKFDMLNNTSGLGLDFNEFVMGLGPAYTNIARNETLGGLLTNAQISALGLSKDVTTGALFTNAQLQNAGLSKDTTVGNLLTKTQLDTIGLSTNATVGDVRAAISAMDAGNLLNVFNQLAGPNGLISKSELIRQATDASLGGIAGINNQTFATAKNTSDSVSWLSAVSTLERTSSNFLDSMTNFSNRIIQALNEQGSMQSGNFGRLILNSAVLLNWMPKLVTTGKETAGGDGGGVSGPVSYAPHALGGLITGPGTGTSDSLLIRASNREYMMQNSALEKFGVSFFDQLNAGIMPSVFNDNGRPLNVVAPVFHGGGNSNAELLAEVRALREEVARLRKENNGGNVAIANTTSRALAAQTETLGDKIEDSGKRSAFAITQAAKDNKEAA